MSVKAASVQGTTLKDLQRSWGTIGQDFLEAKYKDIRGGSRLFHSTVCYVKSTFTLLISKSRNLVITSNNNEISGYP